MNDKSTGLNEKNLNLKSTKLLDDSEVFKKVVKTISLKCSTLLDVNDNQLEDILQKALNYHNENPIQGINNSEYELKILTFGILERVDDEYCYVLMWNPLNSDQVFQKRIPLKEIEKCGISAVKYQMFRFAKYNHKEKLNIEQTLIEPTEFYNIGRI